MPDLSELEKRTENIDALLALLPPQERDTARATLLRQDVESLRLLNHLLSNEQSKRRIKAVSVALPGAIMLAGASLTMMRLGSIDWAYGAVGASGFILLMLSTLNNSFTKLEMAALETLLCSEDVLSTGLVLENLQVPRLPQRRKATASLIQKLPQLTPEAFQHLTPTQRGYLHGILNYIRRDDDLELRLAALTALQQAGDRRCLGAVYMLATGEAATHTAQTVRTAAQTCLDHLLVRLDLGPLKTLPQYIDNACAQVQSEGVDFQGYALCLLTLRQLLPQLTPANYRSVLSERDRDRLYMLLVLRPPFDIGKPHYGQAELMQEIVRTAERLGDTRALKSFQTFAHNVPTVADRQTHTAVRQALPLLEAQVEREKVSRTLLRGASAPDAQPDELLRAAAPAASLTAPNELLRAATPEQEHRTFKTNVTSEESEVVLLQRTDDAGR